MCSCDAAGAPAETSTSRAATWPVDEPLDAVWASDHFGVIATLLSR
jgi:hypothetical protein